MADISELLGNSNPEALKRLLELRDKINYDRPTTSPYSPAAESAKIFEAAPGSAAESAGVFESAMPGGVGIEAGKELVPLAESGADVAAPLAEGIGASALTKLGSAALPATVAYEMLKSEPGHSDEQEAAEMRKLGAFKGSIPLPGQGSPATPIASQELMGPPAPTERVPANTSDKEEPSPIEKIKSSLSKRDNLKANPTPNARSVSDLLSQLNGNDLNDAKQQRNQMQLMAMLGHAGETIGSAFTPSVKPDEAFYKSMLERSNQPVSDIEAAQKLNMEKLKQHELLTKYDTNSPEANILRSLVKQVSPKAKLNMSDDDLNNASTATLENILKGIEGMANRQLSSDYLNHAKQVTKDAKDRVQDDKDRSTFEKNVNASRASSRSVLGKAAQAQVSVDRLLDIVNNPNATAQDMSSVSSDLSQVISGAATISGSAHQEYKNLATDYANGINYIFSHANAVNIPEVKAHVADVANKMRDISSKVIQNNIKSSSLGSGWAKRNPEEAQKIAMASLMEAPSAQVPTSGNTVNVIDPKGNIRAIPKDKVQDALAAGGKLAQ